MRFRGIKGSFSIPFDHGSPVQEATLSPFVKYLPYRIFAAVSLVVITLILAPPMVLISLVSMGKVNRVLMRCWGWLVTRSWGLTFSVTGSEKVVPGTSYIVTPNHQGLADILALVVVFPVPFRWVIKKEILRVPVWGWAVASTGAISVDRSNPQDAMGRLQRGLDKLKGGWSMLIYPEGTRTPDGRLLPFKKGAFIIGVQTGIPILPVTTNGASKVLPRNTFALRPGHITVTISDPIPTEGLSEPDVPELMEKTRQAVAAHLDVAYDPFRRETGKPTPQN
jgi:1-acyl-sn-glycerol-3-phosphate acyltransferase